MSIYLSVYMCVFITYNINNKLLLPRGRSLPSCSKSISSPFLRSGLHSQNSAVFSWMEGGGPWSIPPRHRPMARATDLSRSSSHAQSSDSGTVIGSEVSDASAIGSTFTFSHLAEAFIQSDLQMRKLEAIETNKKAIICKCYDKSLLA